jgi:hypothetical protein
MRLRNATIAVMLASTGLVMALASSAPASAETIFPWCKLSVGDLGTGAGACYFATFEQCRVASAGFGTCSANPAYVPPTATTAPAQRGAMRR